jgi:hypothetical protein
MSVIALAWIGMVSMVLAVLTLRGPVYWMLGIAVVDSQGRDVGRGLAVLRIAITWSLVFAAYFAGRHAGGPIFSFGDAAGIAALLLTAMAAIYAAMHPHRGLPERLTRTWIVRA